MQPDGLMPLPDGMVYAEYVRMYQWMRETWPIACQRRETDSWLSARQWERVRRQAN